MKTITRSILFISLVLFINPSSAQNWQWLSRMGGPSTGQIFADPDEKVTAVTTDASGNIYACGRIRPGCDFNGLIPDTLYGGDDIFLAKFDCTGNTIWVQTAGNPDDNDIAKALALDNMGNIYLTGYVEGDAISRPITFSDTVFSEVATDMFLAKYDTSGNFKWVRIVGPGNVQIGSDGQKMAIDQQGKINVLTYCILPGEFLDGDSVYGREMLIARFNPNGSLNRLLKFSDFGFNTAYTDFKIGPDGQYYITGNFGDDSLTIGGQTIHLINAATGFDMFLFKLDTSGVAQWNIHLGWPSTYTVVSGFGIDFDASGNIAWTGSTVNGIVFAGDTFHNTLDTSLGNDYPFIAKISPQGQPLWVTNLNCRYGIRTLGGVVVKQNGNIVVSGFYSGHAQMGPDTMTSTGVHDMFLAEISSSGTVLHGYPVVGTGEKEIPYCMTVDAHDNVIVGGAFDQTVTINGNNITFAGGSTDAFVANFGSYSCTTGINELRNESDLIHIFPNPSNDKIQVELNSNGALTTISLYTIFANKIFSETKKSSIGKNSFLVDISNLSAGVYLLSVEEDNFTRMAKIIKQ